MVNFNSHKEKKAPLWAHSDSGAIRTHDRQISLLHYVTIAKINYLDENVRMSPSLLILFILLLVWAVSLPY